MSRPGDTEARRSVLERACKADRRIRALDQAVTAMCLAAAVADGPACSGCTWTRIVKPLALPLLGWERGYPQASAKDPRAPGEALRLVNVSEELAGQAERESRRAPASTETERWLRTQEAWDAVTGLWIDRLHEADPAAGHGIGYLSAVDA